MSKAAPSWVGAAFELLFWGEFVVVGRSILLVPHLVPAKEEEGISDLGLMEIGGKVHTLMVEGVTEEQFPGGVVGTWVEVGLEFCRAIP